MKEEEENEEKEGTKKDAFWILKSGRGGRVRTHCEGKHYSANMRLATYR